MFEFLEQLTSQHIHWLIVAVIALCYFLSHFSSKCWRCGLAKGHSHRASFPSLEPFELMIPGMVVPPPAVPSATMPSGVPVFPGATATASVAVTITNSQAFFLATVDSRPINPPGIGQPLSIANSAADAKQRVTLSEVGAGSGMFVLQAATSQGLVELDAVNGLWSSPSGGSIPTRWIKINQALPPTQAVFPSITLSSYQNPALSGSWMLTRTQ